MRGRPWHNGLSVREKELRIKRMISMYIEGVAVIDIMSTYNISYASLRTILKEAGVFKGRKRRESK